MNRETLRELAECQAAGKTDPATTQADRESAMPALRPQFQPSTLRVPPPPALLALKTGSDCAHVLPSNWSGNYCPTCALTLILPIEFSLVTEREMERDAWQRAHALTQQAWQTATAARCGYANFSPTKIPAAHAAARIAANEESVRTAQARCRRTTQLPEEHPHKALFLDLAEQTRAIM